MIGYRARRAVPSPVVAFLGLAMVGATLIVTWALAGRDPAAPAAGPAGGGRAAEPSAADPDGQLRPRPATTVPAPTTPVQQRYDLAFAAGLGGLPGMAAAAELEVPAPAIAGGWPDLAVDATPEGWAEKFVHGLLDIDFAHRDRAALGAWLQAHQSPELLPGVPPAVADKVLYISVLRSDLFGGQATPVPAPAEWEGNAAAGVRQWVSDVVARPNPDWARMVAEGWQPSDPRMTTLDVSGLLTVRRPEAATTRAFSLQLVVGSARWRDGYGTVAVSDWEVS
ncbi:MAG TPA: hypothetical protein VFO65_14395 [Acidimicrobiales bacterium]|nr:hypothetical protein [Acidimicrobiales bacterium]